jgi:hypothetical protein
MGTGKPKRSSIFKIVTHPNSSASSYTSDAVDDLCRFSVWLSLSITSPSIVDRKHLRTMSPRDFLEDAFESYSPLMAVLFGMATATSQRNKDKILATSNHLPRFLISIPCNCYGSRPHHIAMAHDLIIHSNLAHPYRGQLMLNNLMP